MKLIALIVVGIAVLVCATSTEGQGIDTLGGPWFPPPPPWQASTFTPIKNKNCELSHKIIRHEDLRPCRCHSSGLRHHY